MERHRKKRLMMNTMSSLASQFVVIMCGFILPRFILEGYGSNVNGLVSSITQFLGIISFLELGIGSVVQSSLYKPLAENNTAQISNIITSADKFFHKLARILFLYVVILCIAYPYFVNSEFGYGYTIALIVIISLSMFVQYFFGIVNRLLLVADQRGYIYYGLHIFTVILNTVCCCVLIEMNYSIHFVKLVTSIIYIMQPVITYYIIKKRYCINRRAIYEGEPIKQKWNGVAQHIAAVVLDGTDTIILTIFATLAEVSIYSVYYMIVKGLKQLFLSSIGGVTSLVGELWAKKEFEKLKNFFNWMEWTIHTCTTLIFGMAIVLIVPFVQIYTLNISDTNYVQPLFSILIVLANAGHCLRLPYNILILAAGHYKQTQRNYIVATFLNLIVSIIVVFQWGLIGVSIGTILAMFYQTIWMARYVYGVLIQRDMNLFIKQLCVDGITILLICIAALGFSLSQYTYFAWVILAIKVGLVAVAIMLGVNSLFYRDKIISMKNKYFK